VKRKVVTVLAAGGVFLAVSVLQAFDGHLTDEQCLSLMRRLETDKSVYVGPAERECLTRKISAPKIAEEKSRVSPESLVSKATVPETKEQPPPSPPAKKTDEPKESKTGPEPNTPVAAAPPSHKVTAEIRPGFLSAELARFLEKHGWRTLPGWWGANYDYQVVAPYTVDGDKMEDVLAKILSKYRLKARLYRWDKSVRVFSAENGQ
jgi:hypothetical protein